MVAPEILVKKLLGATHVVRQERVQSLWSGYGEIARYQVQGADCPTSVIVKSISLPAKVVHPRGWSGEFSHQRKVASYQVEKNWYQDWASLCSDSCRVPQCYGVWQSDSSELILVLEDLDESGWWQRANQLSSVEAEPCLHWLACFHANFLQFRPQANWPSGLWQTGTYWHLATRPDEWRAMSASALKESAEAIDQRLSDARFQTLVHGDAKVANFCFSEDGCSVAAVDFQYVGAGCGIKDVVYFLGSCLNEDILLKESEYLLSIYFDELARCLVARGDSQAMAQAVIDEWQQLIPFAWADFQRFMLGWCPDHVKNTPYARAMTQQALASL